MIKWKRSKFIKNWINESNSIIISRIKKNKKEKILFKVIILNDYNVNNKMSQKKILIHIKIVKLKVIK